MKKIHKKPNKVSYKEIFDQRKEHLIKAQKVMQLKRLLGDKVTLSPELNVEKLDELLSPFKKGN